ncbi:CLUMA_CG019503, isoform A, partial [Clunio marinus]
AKASAQCDKLPENLNLEGCCKFSIIAADDTVKKVLDEFKDQKLPPAMMQCKMSEEMFKEYKLTKGDGVDKEAFLNHVENKVLEPIWKPIMKNAVEECYKGVSRKTDEIVKELEDDPFNIKRDECNPIYMSIVTCIQLEAFENCPKELWANEKKCNDARTWITECGDNVESLKQIIKAKKSKH